MNLPNKLTVIRILLVPVMVIIPFLGIKGEIFEIGIDFWIMNLIFIIASITDKLDGYIARSRDLVTNFGKFLDPLADKILVLAAMVILVEKGLLPAWIPVIVLAREFIVSGFRLIAVEKGGKVIAASIWGKLKTVVQMVALPVCMVLAYLLTCGYNVPNALTLTVQIISYIAIGLATLLTVLSGINYVIKNKECFKE